VFGAVMTYFAWNERLQPIEWLGISVIILSGILAMRVEKKEQIEEAGFES
jgi:drug/metabolite transporter (DMT)-like permease